MNESKNFFSLSDILALDFFRRRQSNPWTPADEARADAKRAKEQAAYDSWNDEHPTAEEESLGEEFDGEVED